MDVNQYWQLVNEYDEFKKLDYAPLIDTVTAYQNSAAIMEQADAGNVISDLEQITQLLNGQNLKNLGQSYEDKIRKFEVEFLQHSYKHYDEVMKFYTVDNVVKYYDNIDIRKEVQEVINGKIGGAINWQYPGMELSPGANLFTDKLVGLDPLYIVDKHKKILARTKESFSPAYQQRLRTYRMGGDADFRALPQGQMGLIFSFGFFERLPLDIIKIYMREFWNLLRPGGKVIMTYNNCLLKSSLNITIFHNYRLFNTKEYVEPVVYGMGFDNIVSTDISANITVLEFQKPGELVTQRAGQTLGKIQKTY